MFVLLGGIDEPLKDVGGDDMADISGHDACCGGWWVERVNVGEVWFGEQKYGLGRVKEKQRGRFESTLILEHCGKEVVVYCFGRAGVYHNAELICLLAQDLLGDTSSRP